MKSDGYSPAVNSNGFINGVTGPPGAQAYAPHYSSHASASMVDSTPVMQGGGGGGRDKARRASLAYPSTLAYDPRANSYSLPGGQSRRPRRGGSSSSNTPFQPLLTRLLSSPLPSRTTLKFTTLCALWYSTSAVSSNTGKVILNHFKYPVTLTIVQFFFVAGYCWLITEGTTATPVSWILRRIAGRPLTQVLGGTGRMRLKTPTRAILMNTWPMAVFQVGGHIFSSMAISRVPVSTVHTIKALSPLFTVLAYALLFKVSYSPATYLSLLPLTLGVMLACSFDISASNILGLICAFGSTIVFVSQNIVFKKLMPSAGSGSTGTYAQSAAAGLVGGSVSGPISTAPTSAKLDKINLLFYSSGMAFLAMIPLWVFSDMPGLIALWLDPASHQPTSPASSTNVSFYLFVNGTVHFAQNFLAFAILSSTSPVTYSIASLVKRIAVICLAIIWFNQVVHPVQAIGIFLTGIGLWMYNSAKQDVEKGEKKVRRIEAVGDGMLPLNRADQRILDERSETSTPVPGDKGRYSSPIPAYGFNTDISLPAQSSAVKGPFGYEDAGLNARQPLHSALAMNQKASHVAMSPPPTTAQLSLSSSNSPPVASTIPPVHDGPSIHGPSSNTTTMRRKLSNDHHASKTAAAGPAAMRQQLQHMQQKNKALEDGLKRPGVTNDSDREEEEDETVLDFATTRRGLDSIITTSA